MNFSLAKCLIILIIIKSNLINGYVVHENSPDFLRKFDLAPKENVQNMGNLSPTQFLRLKKSLKQNSIQRTLLVKLNRKLELFERVAVTGNDVALGNWKLSDAIILDKINNETERTDFELWTVKLKVPVNAEIEYRYFIAITGVDSQISVVEWETHMGPRILNNLTVSDEFGQVNGITSIEKGWLNNESIVQLKFYRNPFQYTGWENATKIFIKINPMHSENVNCIEPLAFEPIQQPSMDVKIEATKIAYNQSSLKSQTEDGVSYSYDDIVIFHVTVRNLKRIGYLVHLSEENSDDTYRKPVGFQTILPSDLKGSEGYLDLPIISQIDHRPIGFMKLSYLIIRPLPIAKQLTMRSTFVNYWPSNWTNLDIGHRGLGVSFKHSADIQPPAPENTVASLKQSVLEGADMVEFDVHLTKDLIAVIYHDFHVKVTFKSGRPEKPADLTEILIKDLTYEQLKQLTTYQVVNGNEVVEYASHYDEPREDYRLFPLLETFFEKIDKSVGFDIEIKWPQQFLGGGVESVQTLDKNIFADRILQTLLEKGCGRAIFMSSFDADLCTMLKFKQNVYPVMFLVLGETKRYQLYDDPRCNSIENAVANAQAWNFLGVVPHTEDFFRDPELVKLATDLKQTIFAWGHDADSVEAIEKLKNMGLNGVIYDRVDKFCEKTESIFKGDEFKKLFEKQCLR